MSRRYLGSISVDVDIADVLDDLDDETIREEAEARGLSVGDGFDLDYVRRAHQALMAGRPAEALALLDTALFPVRPSNSDYEKHLARLI